MTSFGFPWKEQWLYFGPKLEGKLLGKWWRNRSWRMVFQHFGPMPCSEQKTQLVLVRGTAEGEETTKLGIVRFLSTRSFPTSIGMLSFLIISVSTFQYC